MTRTTEGWSTIPYLEFLQAYRNTETGLSQLLQPAARFIEALDAEQCEALISKLEVVGQMISRRGTALTYQYKGRDHVFNGVSRSPR